MPTGSRRDADGMLTGDGRDADGKQTGCRRDADGIPQMSMGRMLLLRLIMLMAHDTRRDPDCRL